MTLAIGSPAAADDLTDGQSLELTDSADVEAAIPDDAVASESGDASEADAQTEASPGDGASEAGCAVEAPDEAGAVALAAECGHDVEVLSERTEWQTLYAQADGSMRVDISMAAVRTEVSGDWADIDTTVIEGDDGGLVVASPVAEMTFSDGTSGEPLARMVRDGHEIAMDVPFELTEPEVMGDSVMYPDVLPGVDLIVSVNEDGTGFSEVLRVESADAAANPQLAELVFPVETSDGLDLVAQDGGFTALDDSGEDVFVSPMPTIWDSSAEQALVPRSRGTTVVARVMATVADAAAAHQRATTRLQAPVEGDVVAEVPVEVTTDAVTLVPDDGILSDEGTIWPVYIDPSVGAVTPFQRMAVRSGDSNYYNFPEDQGTGFCNHADPYGSSCQTSFRSRLMYEFNNLQPIGDIDRADVVAASFSVFGTHSYSCTATSVQLYRIPPFTSTTGWPGNSWTNLLQTQTIAHRPSCNNARLIEWDILPAAQALADEGGGTLAFGLKAADETTMTGWKRYQWDARISIVYNRAPRRPTDVRVAAGTRIQECPEGTSAYIGNGPTNIWAKLSDPDGGNLRGNFNIYPIDGNGTVGDIIFNPAMTGPQASGQFHNVTVAEGAIPQLVDGGHYLLQVDATDDFTFQGVSLARWSPKRSCTLIADLNAPQSPPVVVAEPVTPEFADHAQYVEGGQPSGALGQPGRFTFTADLQDGTTGFVYSLNEDALDQYVAGTVVTVTLTPDGFGPQTLRVATVDAAGNLSPEYLYDFVVTRTGPTAEWRLDSVTGGVSPATSGNIAHALSTYDAPTLVTGATGVLRKEYGVGMGTDRALRFSGNARAVTSGPVLATDASFTVMAMVRLTSIPADNKSATAVSQDGTNVAGFSLGYRAAPYCTGTPGGCWSFFMYDQDVTGISPRAVQSTDVPAVANEWVQLAGVYDDGADQMQLYVCTVPATQSSGAVVDQIRTSYDSVSAGPEWNSTTGKLRVGMAMQAGAFLRQFPGDVSGVRVYQGVADESDFSRGCAKGYWDMPLGSGGEEASGMDVTLSESAPGDEAPEVTPLPDAGLSAPAWPTAGQGVITVTPQGQNVAFTRGVGLMAAVPAGQQAPEVVVQVLSRATTVNAGIDGVLFDITPLPAQPDGSGGLQALPGGAVVDVVVDYSSFADAYGGDWASRLRLVRLDANGVPEELETTNDVAESRLTAEGVHLAATARMGVTSGASGSAGSWSATPLSASANWQVSAQTGNFSWSYPMRVPASPGGPEPELSLNYSSGSLDGRVAGANNQGSWVGDGWDLTTGYIERKYVPCVSDMEAVGENGANNDGRSFDLCWKTDNATLVFGGQAQELVLDEGTGYWHPKNDDGTRIVRDYDAPNGDNNGEYWIVTTTDGTQYYFGLERRDKNPAAPSQGSTWTVPVFGNNGGGSPGDDEPCYSAAGFQASSCAQAWRWNLDYVIDTSGNVMSYWYTEEGNGYTTNVVFDENNRPTGQRGPVAQYVRGGYLSRIDYGQHKDAVTGVTLPSQAPMWVQFDVEERCLNADGCTDGVIPDGSRNFPDVPTDQICTSATSCPRVTSPAFFTRKQLNWVTTYVRDGGETRAVDRWDLNQTFPEHGDGTSPSLWLDSIEHVGSPGMATSVSLPSVRFTGEQMDNRVDVIGDGAPAMSRYRVTGILSESGATTTVDYTDAECTNTNRPAADGDAGPVGYFPYVSANDLRCFPVIWTREGATVATPDYFQKYLVNEVTMFPGDGISEPVRTSYEYEGAPAWRHDDSVLVPQPERTWGLFAGYATVTIRTGTRDEGPGTIDDRTKVTNVYFRGLNGDYMGAGVPARSVVLDGIPDDEALAGFVRTATTFNGDEVLSSVVNTPWRHTTGTGSDGTMSEMVRVGVTESTLYGTHLTSGERVTRTQTLYDNLGMAVWVLDHGDIADRAGINDDEVVNDDLCTHIEYARNTGRNILTTVSRAASFGTACTGGDDTVLAEPGATTSEPARNTLQSETLTTYNERGLPTRVRALAEDSATPRYIETTTGYDSYGRITSVTDPLGRTTTTAYSPSSGGPITATTVTTPDPDGPDAAGRLEGFEATTIVDPAWGTPVAVIDANDRTTTATYDGLGRLTAVFLPGDDAARPSTTYRYAVSASGTNSVTTRSLGVDGRTYRTSVAFYDGLLRPRQTQTESAARGTPGRIITETVYDSRGQVWYADGPWFTTEEPSWATEDPQTSLVAPNRVVPSATYYTYDGAGRATAEQFRVDDVAQWTNLTTYDGNRVTVTPPDGGVTQTTVTSARGQVIGLIQYTTDDLSGPTQTTSYEYDPAGRMVSMTDADVNAAGAPEGNTWTYAYDLLGRQVSASDPDRGTTTTTYDDAGQVLTTTDARGETLAYAYDGLGRKTGVWPNGVGDESTQLASWKYDTQLNGQLTSTTRYLPDVPTDGDTLPEAYVTRVTGYDERYRPLGQAVTIPASETGLAGTYTTTYTYTDGGGLESTTLPKIGNVPAETLTTVYDESGMPRWLMGAGAYVADASYSAFGEPLQYDLGSTYAASVNYAYAHGSRRLDRAWVWAEGDDGYFMDTRYTYDDAGNPLMVVDAPSVEATVPGAEARNTQCYTYDGLGRLTQAWTPDAEHNCSDIPSQATLGGPAPFGFTDTFDAIGNRTERTAYTVAGSTNTHYSYGESGPHQLSEVTVDGTTVPVASFSYDAAGNTTLRDPVDRDAQTLTWDLEGRLGSVTGGSAAQYVYTADGDRLVRREGGVTTLYLPGGQEVSKSPTGVVTGTRYYAFNGQTVAVRTGAGYAGVTTLVSDPHGTAQVAIDTTTNSVSRRYFDPYGRPVGGDGGDWSGDHGFLDKPVDETGLVQVGARYYDPSVGRFISVDPVMDLADPQQWHGYAYANNNPVTNSDPTGLYAVQYDGGSGGQPPSTPYTPGYTPARPPTVKERLAEVVVILADVERARDQANRDFVGNLALSQSPAIVLYNVLSPCTNGLTECARSLFNFNVPLAEPIWQTVSAAADGRWGDVGYSAQTIFMEVGTAVALGVVGGGGKTGTVRPAGAAETAGGVGADLATAEAHLGTIDGALEFGPNKAMLQEIRGAQSSGTTLSPAQRAFLDHEVKESQLVSEGITQEAAHDQIMQRQPVGANYSPQVIKQHSEWFSDAYFDYWGISR